MGRLSREDPRNLPVDPTSGLVGAGDADNETVELDPVADVAALHRHDVAEAQTFGLERLLDRAKLWSENHCGSIELYESVGICPEVRSQSRSAEQIPG